MYGHGKGGMYDNGEKKEHGDGERKPTEVGKEAVG